MNSICWNCDGIIPLNQMPFCKACKDRGCDDYS